MTKDEATKAMMQGEKVTHRYFTPNEWMTMISPNLIKTEDGYIHKWYEFWQIRQGDAWETDYSIWQESKHLQNK